MNKEDLQEIAQAAAKNIKTEQDLNEFRQILTKITVEAALNAELDDHLGYERHEKDVLKGFSIGRWLPTIIILEDNSYFEYFAIRKYMKQIGYTAFMGTKCE